MKKELKILIKIIIAVVFVTTIAFVGIRALLTNKLAPEVVAELHTRAERGDAEAQYKLGENSIDLGYPATYPKGYFWYSKAAEQGHPMAQYELGLLHFYGYGTDKNPVLAYKWITLARTTTNEREREWIFKRSGGELKRLETQMTPEQLHEAKELVKNWKPIPSNTGAAPQQAPE